jgi:hypothetical protein
MVSARKRVLKKAGDGEIMCHACWYLRHTFVQTLAMEAFIWS